jgi:hypothetical protein
MVVEISGGAQLRAPSPIGRPLNPGGQTAQLRLLYIIIIIISYTVGARAKARDGTGYRCAIRSWKWVGRLLYAIQASSFFFLSGQSGDQDGCFPVQGMHLCFVRSSFQKQSRVACPIVEQILHREMFLHIFATCPYEK